MREQRVVHTPCPLNCEQRVMCATRARELASRSAVPAAITLRRLACACGRPVAVVALCSLLPLLRVLSRQLWPRLSPFDVVCAVCESERGRLASCVVGMTTGLSILQHTRIRVSRRLRKPPSRQWQGNDVTLILCQWNQ